MLLRIKSLEGDPLVLILRHSRPTFRVARPLVSIVLKEIASGLVHDLAESVDMNPVILVELPVRERLTEPRGVGDELGIRPGNGDLDQILPGLDREGSELTEVIDRQMLGHR